MNQFELYIGESLIEVDEKFNLTMLFSSSVFQDLDKVQANRTTTLKIPKTAVNLKAIDFSNIPENNTLFPYQTKPVELFKNGIPIIQNGKGYVLTISDHIEFTVIWGVDINIKELQNLKLRSLSGDDYVFWDNNGIGNYIQENSNYGFALADFIKSDNLDDKLLIFHPFVLTNWIFDKITDKVRYSINFPDYIKDIYDYLAFPLIEKNAAPLINGNDVLKFNFIGNFEINIVDDPYNFVSGNQIIIQEDCNISFSGKIRYRLIQTVPQMYQLDWVKLQIYKNGILQKEASLDYEFYGLISEIFYMEINDDISIECKENDIITFKLLSHWVSTSWQLWTITRFSYNDPLYDNSYMGGYFTMTVKPAEITPGKNFPIIPNLPDISAYELLQTIMAMFGLFGIYTEKGIEFFNVEDFYTKKDNAIDWTEKVITGKNIDAISFAIGDFDKKNWLKYAEDDTVNINADGHIESNNDSLEDEKTLYQMKVAASDGSSTIHFADDVFLYIPLYTPTGEYDDNQRKLFDYGKVKDRICMINFNNEAPHAYFPPTLYFEQLISRFYHSYQKIIFQPKLIEVTVYLTDLEIYQLDLMTPVYLEQTGNYYIISELQVNENNTAKAKLIQM